MFFSGLLLALVFEILSRSYGLNGLNATCQSSIKPDSPVTAGSILDSKYKVDLALAYENRSICFYQKSVLFNCSKTNGIIKKMIVKNGFLLVLRNSEVFVFDFDVNKNFTSESYTFKGHKKEIIDMIDIPNSFRENNVVITNDPEEIIYWDVTTGRILKRIPLRTNSNLIITYRYLYVAGSKLFRITYFNETTEPLIENSTINIGWSNLTNIFYTTARLYLNQVGSNQIFVYDDKNISSNATLTATINLDSPLKYKGIDCDETNSYFFIITSKGFRIYNYYFRLLASLNGSVEGNVNPVLKYKYITKELFLFGQSEVKILNLSQPSIAFDANGKCYVPSYCYSKNCSVCKEGNSSKCEVCQSGFFNYNDSCVKTCPTTISSVSNTTCCSKNCSTCSSRDNCTGCQKQYFLFQGTCLSCASRNKYCSECKGDFKCTVCYQGYENIKGSCVKSCSTNYFINEQTLKCEKCLVKNCKKCRAAQDCFDCFQDYLWKPSDFVCSKIVRESSTNENDTNYLNILIPFMIIPFCFLLFLIGICYKKLKRKPKNKRSANSSKVNDKKPSENAFEKQISIKDHPSPELVPFDENKSGFSGQSPETCEIKFDEKELKKQSTNQFMNFNENPENFAVDQPGNFVADQAENFAVDQPGNFAADQPENFAVDQPENFAIDKEKKEAGV